MAITQNSQSDQEMQTAVCKEARTVKTSKGDRKVYVLSLDGKDFEVWESKDFAPAVGEVLKPFVVVIPYAYSDSSGRPRAEMRAAVNWRRA